jgi:hypothetical protein
MTSYSTLTTQDWTRAKWNETQNATVSQYKFPVPGHQADNVAIVSAQSPQCSASDLPVRVAR